MEELSQALEEARRKYAAANPRSEQADQEAQRYLPGGNTRSVLHYEPFPLTMVAGEGAELIDRDGHRYVDFVSEYSAGLYGHSDPVIKSAIRQALDSGIAMGAPTPGERELAELLCERFPSLEQVRFCNSGTEANLMAITTARVVTGRNKVLVFDGAYHGGVIKFPTGRSDFNVPFDYILADYNQIESTADRIRSEARDLAAVVVEPVLGAGGNIPGSQEFLRMLRGMTEETGALLVFDEVKTARLGAAGMQGLLGIEPDLTTLGKIIGGGLPTGAFGGKAELMACYNPRQEKSWKHAGTFNNNACSMAAGCAAMGEIFTRPVAEAFHERSESFRESLNRLFSEDAAPMQCRGLGSMFAVHFADGPAEGPEAKSDACQSLHSLMHLELLLDGVLICRRGDLFLSLPMTDGHFERARASLKSFIERRRSLIQQVREQGFVAK